MYLKSLEVQGFKAFANKIVFEFHNGITGIVGPNGSGKSNVADAVRWVLGEQSAKQLRGSSMQDVIFAGTENRKPLSYAYVAITLDNSDHQLPIDYEEVTVARRVYRSGESEYLLNGTVCRLKEVTELFYDTGIGKEGYSIIGQGQIDRILSGKPEERRELFDEAAGIVKYKKRKAATQKKLDREQENLVRISDILSELERQVGPLSRQSEKAKQYLRLRDELKDYEINLYLLDSARMEAQLTEIGSAYDVASAQLAETNEAYEKVKADFDRLEEEIAGLDAQIESVRGQISSQTLLKEKLKSQIDILTEQIHTAETSDEHYKSRLEALASEKEAREGELAEYNKKEADLRGQAAAAREHLEEKERSLDYARAVAEGISEQLRHGQEELQTLLNRKTEIETSQQRYQTMVEQVNIRKGQLNRRLLESQSKEGNLADVLSEYSKAYEDVTARIEEVRTQESALDVKTKEWKIKLHDNTRQIEEARSRQMKLTSQLEALRNIAERYDGYGNSIRRVMERKRDFPGILGVVSDLISVEKQYETAIETALGGSIQNIVTEDEETARRMIEYLKENRYGRATFLPLTSVTARGTFQKPEALREQGVRGLASNLVSCEDKYRQVVEYLLGRIVVVDTVDHALMLARKYRYSLNIVTIEGEHLSPGGSLSGGAFKNANHLLARNREIEEMEKKHRSLSKEIESLRTRGTDIQTAVDLNSEELEEVSTHLQELYIQQNTAKVNLESAKQQQEESEALFAGLAAEGSELETELAQIAADQEKTVEELAQIAVEQEAQQEANSHLEGIYAEKCADLEQEEKAISQLQMEIAAIEQNCGFAKENCARIQGELDKYEAEVHTLEEGASLAKEDIEKKQADIASIRESIEQSEAGFAQLESELASSQAQKEERSTAYKACLAQREEMTEHRSLLDKEIFRLESQREKVNETLQNQTNYLWEEYEITPHAALEHRKEEYAEDPAELRKQAAECRNAIKALGSVNVNAVEEYKEVSERYEFQKAQYDDIMKAQETLMGIITELDQGMTEQFTQKFAEIQREYDKSFRQLFGGGHGRLELVEGEDILECGIRIIAQPPGKKLQNMMQLSGGEKALSAIALLFAIQALKPSPFCLLDEIEAALDDANVGRYAEYLRKLTDHTQFIVITHRRGTMAAADRLYGITMQEKGVSTLVSVDLVEADLED